MVKEIERAEANNVNPFSTQPAVQRYLFASQFIKNKIVLDVACGIGYGSDTMKIAQPSAIVVGGDGYFNGLTYGKNVYKKQIKFFQLDALHLPFADSTFDVIVSMETIEHLTNLNEFLKEVNRVLKIGGLFVCSTPNRLFTERIGGTGDNPFHLKEFVVEELEKILLKYFNNLKFYGQKSVGSDILHRFPITYKMWKILRHIIVPLARKKVQKVYEINSLDPKFQVIEYDPKCRTIVFVVEKLN